MEEKTLSSRIFKYNIVLIIIPVFTLIFVGLIGMFAVKQSLDNEQINSNAVYIESYFSSLNSNNINLNVVDNYVEENGYDLFYSINGSPLLSIDGESPKLDNIFIREHTSIISIMGYTIVTRKIPTENGVCSLMAVAESKTNLFIQPRLLFSILVYTLLITFILLLFTSLFLTRKLSKSIEEPIEKLVQGTKRIKQGNLDEKIVYTSNEYEEFTRVCDTFNDMMDNLKHNIEMKEKIEQDRKVLIAGISHDLKTPLTSIKGYTKGLIDGVAKTDEKRQDYLKIIYEKAETLEKLFNQLTAVSDLQNDSVNVNINSVNVKKYFEELINEIKLENENDKVEISANIKVRNQKFLIDEMHFGRVIYNVVSNSKKYSNVDLIKINFNIFEENNNIVVEIKDNGIGVSEENLDKIFELCYRVDDSRTTPQNGSGIGLSISKQIVEKFGGNIKATNENGLKIRIEIPKEV